MLTYPDEPSEPTCALLFVPIELVPIVGGLFKQLESRRKWASDNDYQQGYRAFVELQAQLMSNCLETLIQEIRAIRGVKPDYSEMPAGERTTDMYRDFNDIIGHLNTLIFYLGGGEEHADNVIKILRGVTPATEERNLLEMLE